jgi:type IV pilus assembly protein PilP
MMGKHLVIMRYLTRTICIVLLLWGCDRSLDATAQPKVVRKKVVAQRKQIAKVRTNETIRTVKTTKVAPRPKVVRKKVVARKEQTAKVRNNQTIPVAKKNQTARSSKKTAAVKTEKFQAKAKNLVAPGTTPDRQTLVAKKVDVLPTGDTAKKLPASKKPAIRPRSDISDIMQSSGGESTAPSDKLIAATSNMSPRTRSTAIPKAYDAKGKIDPFEPLFKEKPVSVKKKKNKKRIPQTPLERIDLSQLKLVGIILASSGNRALVEESSGKGYVIKKGTYIGVNSGKVVKIKREKVVVEEEFEDVFGKTKLRQREIKLPKPPGEF